MFFLGYLLTQLLGGEGFGCHLRCCLVPHGTAQLAGSDCCVLRRLYPACNFNCTAASYPAACTIVSKPRWSPLSGALADRYGGKGVLAAGVAAWSLTTCLTPPAAYIGLPALIGMRCAEGLLMVMLWAVVTTPVLLAFVV